MKIGVNLKIKNHYPTFFELIDKSTTNTKTRKVTTVSRAAKEKRLQKKKKAGEIKSQQKIGIFNKLKNILKLKFEF